MKREILFRGKSTADGQWVYGSYILRGSYNYILFEGMEIPVHPLSVGQFTSLSDRNGKEVYEGDLVNVYVSSRKMAKLEIKYIERSFVMARPKEVDTNSFDCVWYYEFEVVGNIFALNVRS